MHEPITEVDVWKDEVLDFLAVRGQALFSNWTPRTNPELIREIGGPDWESLLVRNMVAAPKFERDVRRAIAVVGRELVQDRRPVRNQTRGRLKGRLLARETVRTRLRKADPTLWVSEARSREWQTDANAAVVGFLNHVRRGARGAELPPSGEAGIAALNQLLAIQPLRSVAPDQGWSNFIMPPWLTAKNELYRLIWSWADEFRRGRVSRDARALRELMDSGWLVAESRDRLFELFALSHTVTALHADTAWSDFELQLKSEGDRKVGVVARTPGGLVATLRFDRKPPTPGVYGALLAHYDAVDGRGRRPDLQLELEWSDNKITTLIEVKATQPNSTYGRDSVVKVFGYLKDYALLWPNGSRGVPKAMLLFADEVRANVALSRRVAGDEVLLCSPTTFAKDFSAVFAAQLEFLSVPQDLRPKRARSLL